MILLVGKPRFLDKALPCQEITSALTSSGMYGLLSLTCQWVSFCFDFSHQLNLLLQFDYVFADKELKI